MNFPRSAAAKIHAVDNDNLLDSSASPWSVGSDRSSSKRSPTREERDEARGYSVNIKQVVLAFAVEFWIIGLIVVGTYLLIAESGDNGRLSSAQIFSALLMPAALAMVELARVPLAIAVRTQDAWPIKILASIGVGAAITVTTFSLSQIAYKTFDIRISEATSAGDRLAEAKANRDNFEGLVKASAADIEQKITARNSVNERLGKLQEQIGQLKATAGKSCKPSLGPDGRPVLGQDGRPVQICSDVTTVSAAQINALNLQLANTKKELESADGAVARADQEHKKLSRREVDEQLRQAESEYRIAVNKSQLHSYTAMVTGKAVSEVTEAEVKNLEKYLVVIPSIAAAFASTLIAMTAVRRRKSKVPPVTTLPDEAAAYLFGPLVDAIRAEAKQAVASAVNKSKTTPP